MFVSRDNRERKANKSSFWASKWVHLKDGKENFVILFHFVPMFTLIYLLPILSFVHLIFHPQSRFLSLGPNYTMHYNLFN